MTKDEEIAKLREALARIGATTRETWTTHPVCKACNLSLIPASTAGRLPTCRAGIGGWCAGQEAREAAALAPAGTPDEPAVACKDCGKPGKPCPSCGGVTCDGCAENVDESCCPAPPPWPPLAGHRVRYEPTGAIFTFTGNHIANDYEAELGLRRTWVNTLDAHAGNWTLLGPEPRASGEGS